MQKKNRDRQKKLTHIQAQTNHITMNGMYKNDEASELEIFQRLSSICNAIVAAPAAVAATLPPLTLPLLALTNELILLCAH